MRYPIIIGCAILWIVVGSHGGYGTQAQEITTLIDSSGKEIDIAVSTGEHWIHSFRVALLMKINAPPQVAIWLEDVDGRFIDTLYVTSRFARQQWKLALGQKKNETLRREALPYWLHKRSAKGLVPPTKASPLPDAVTGATQKESFILHTKAETDLQHVYVLLEANVPFDFNETYAKQAKRSSARYNKRSGQPAIVYRTKIDLRKPGTYTMKPVGHSSPSGEGGQLYEDLNGLTTALEMIEKALVIVQ